MFHRLCGPPSIPLSFNLATVVPRRITYRVSYDTEPAEADPTSSDHRLRRGLPGYLILFAPHAFVFQRQVWTKELPSQSVFLSRSTHFTATPRIPLLSSTLQHISIRRESPVRPRNLTTDLIHRLHTLYALVIPNNARTLRITAAAGTKLASAFSNGTIIPRLY